METTKKYPDPIMSDINITNHGIAKLLSNLDPSKAGMRGSTPFKCNVFHIFNYCENQQIEYYIYHK
jgi:hypothetical protein